jgi:hypothetical protein
VDHAAFQRWWELHLRVARGDLLNAEERDCYNAGRQDLDGDEKLEHVKSTREAREQLQALEVERTQLERRRHQLESELAALEKRLQEQARQLLGVEK